MSRALQDPALKLLLASALTTLPACKEKLEIIATSLALPHPSFELKVEDRALPRFTEGRVFETEDEDRIVWSFRAQVPGVTSGAHSLTYGEEPEGFRATHSPEPLKAGTPYTLVLVGRGLGRLEFTPEPAPKARSAPSSAPSPPEGASD